MMDNIHVYITHAHVWDVTYITHWYVVCNVHYSRCTYQWAVDMWCAMYMTTLRPSMGHVKYIDWFNHGEISIVHDHVIWRMHVCDMTHPHVSWLIPIHDMTDWYVWHGPCVCDTIHLHAWQDLFIFVSVLHMCDVPHSYVCPNSFTCVTWLIHMCDMI